MMGQFPDETLIDLLYPKDLIVSEAKIERALIVGSCLAQEGMLVQFKKSSPDTEFLFELFNNPHDFSVPSPESLNLQIIHFPLRAIFTDKVIRFKDFLFNQDIDEWIEELKHKIRLYFEIATKYARSHSVSTIVCSFLLPQTPIAPSLKQVGTKHDLVTIIKILNFFLAELAAKSDHCYFVDCECIAANIGKSSVLDDWYHLFTHNSTPNQLRWTEHTEHPYYLLNKLPPLDEIFPIHPLVFYAAMWAHVSGMYRSINQIDQVKVVIFDLDNTLIRGLIAENYSGDPDKAALRIGWPEGLHEAVQHLRARGIVIALCSKNDPEVVSRFWSTAFMNGWVLEEDFIIKEIGWQPKAEAIARILAQLNLTEKSAVFVDDNVLEAEAVRRAFPKIRTIGSNQLLTKTKLLRSAECMPAKISSESIKREDMLRGQFDREVARASQSREEFLASIECKIRIFEVGEESAHMARCLELINKTNQFNTTGERRSASEIDSILKSGGKLICFEVSDRYSEYGLVGVIILHDSVFVQFVMSCRIIGLGVEESVLSLIMQKFPSKTGQFFARERHTELNTVSRGIFSRVGFTFDENSGDWKRNAVGIPQVHAHLTIIDELPLHQ